MILSNSKVKVSNIQKGELTMLNLLLYFPVAIIAVVLTSILFFGILACLSLRALTGTSFDPME